MAFIDRRFYKIVSANSTETDDYVMAANETVFILLVGGNAGISEDSIVQIIWNPGGADEEILFVTHGDDRQELNAKQFTGDGTKKLRIKLTNDKSVSDYIGAYWSGRAY